MHAHHAILEAAQSWVGVPYRKAGRDRRRGVDCLNFIGLAYRDAGIIDQLPEWRDYPYGFWKHPGDPIIEAIEEGLLHLSVDADVSILRMLDGDIPDRTRWRPGDLLCLCQLRKLEKTTHTAIVEKVEKHAVTILHARQGRGGKVEREQLCAAWRVRGIYRAVGWVA